MYVVGDEMAKMIREYLKMRPSNAKTNRLFLQWRKGKCVNQVMGKHSIAKIPKEVATFLKLPEPQTYTGHSYRRSGATMAADAGFSITELKRLGGWKSDKVCEGYIQESLGYKRKMSKKICDAINLPKSDESIDDTIDIVSEVTPAVVLSSSACVGPMSSSETSSVVVASTSAMLMGQRSNRTRLHQKRLRQLLYRHPYVWQTKAIPL